MGLLSPWFLAGLLAAGLPVWLHLLRRSQHTPRPFSSLMFFERRVESSSKHRRLRYLSLLASRIALLALLALGFASPFVNRTENSLRKKRVAVIAVDRSFSMRSGDRMAQARNAAHAIVRGLPVGQLAQVMAFDRRVENMTGLEIDRAALNAAIEAVQPTDLESSYGELVRALHVLAQSKDTALDVHLVSDMQQTSMPQDFHALALGETAILRTHQIGKPGPNWTVETVVTSPRVYDVTKTQLTATVAGWETPAAKPRVQLLLDGKAIDEKELPVPAAGHAEVEFRGFNVPFGEHRGEVRIDPADALTPDNRFLFSVERSEPLHILFLYSHGRARQAFYYKAALSSASDTGLDVEPFAVEQLEGKDLSRYAFVVLNDLGSLDKDIEQKICSFVMGGKAALVAIGPDTVRAGRIPLSKLAVTGVKQAQSASLTDSQRSPALGSNHFDNVQFFHTGRWTPGEDDRVIARLADRSPLLVEEPMGEGRILQFAASLDNTSSDFPLHAAYLPFVAQTGRYLSGGDAIAASYPAGSVITLRRIQGGKSGADVTGPDGKHELSLAQSKGNTSFEADREGFYDIVRADGRRLLVAAHADRRESDLRTVPEDTLELWRNTGNTSAAPQRESSKTETRRWSFWRYILILAIVAALVESFVARRYSQEGQRTV